MINEELVHCIFNFNPYTNQWQTTRRENYIMLHNDIQNPLVYRSTKISTLEEMILKNKLK